MKETKSYYRQQSGKYDDTFDMLYYKIYDLITWKYIEPYVPTNTNALVLDAGGGTGRWAIQLAKKGPKVILLDLSEDMLKIAAEKAKDQRLQHRISIEVGDITKTEYADATFDMILCEHAFFLFEKPDIVLREMNRLLKRKAPLIISAQNRYPQTLLSLSDKPDPKELDNALHILLREKYNAIDGSGKVKIYTWTPSEFQTLLETNGFDVEKIIGKGMTMPIRISKELYVKKKYNEELFKKLLKIELALCEKPDALALAGHLQAIAYKR
jgi:ubiquinone/menaquinone biosynthesis C-methylase UbiE